MRIIYILPKSSGPSGGVKTLYEHVRILRTSGYDAKLYAARHEYRAPGFGIDVPVLSGGIPLNGGDLVVRAEVSSLANLEHGARLGYRQAIFVQNHFYCHKLFEHADRFSELGVEQVFCSSRTIARFLESEYGLSGLPVVPYAIEGSESSPTKILNSVAYMPRKRPRESDAIRAFVDRDRSKSGNGCESGPIEWIEIDHMPHAQTLEYLSRAEIFLSLQRQEGFGLPALEAMAAGCNVIGFTGGGGDEYATAENGIWCEGSNADAVGQALVDLLRQHKDQDPAVQRMITSGYRTVAEYDAKLRDTALLNLFKTFSWPS